MTAIWRKERWELHYTRMYRACASKYPGMHPADVVSYLRLGEQMTLQQVAEHLGVALTTVRRWQRPDVSIHVVTEREIAAKRECMRRINERRRRRA